MIDTDEMINAADTIAAAAGDSTETILGITEKIMLSDTTIVGKAAAIVDNIAGLSHTEILNFLLQNIATIGFKILIAFIIYFLGRKLTKYLLRITKTLLEKKDVDVSLQSFAISFINIVLMTTIFMIIVGVLGIDTTSLVAIFASAGLAVGMALSGTLQNFAGGILILFLKPFKVGDFIETQGQTGTVKSIQLFNMTLNTPDNKIIIIPNGGVANNIINNYSKEDSRRVDWSFGIAYGDSYDKAKEILTTLCAEDSRILKNPDTFIALEALADSSVNIVVRAWVSTADYWGVYFDMNEKVYKKFSEEGINIPFPQMDVHIKKD